MEIKYDYEEELLDVFMLVDIAHFILRLALIVMIWVFIWRHMRPRNQLMRILRAALLVLGMLGVLAVMKIASG